MSSVPAGSDEPRPTSAALPRWLRLTPAAIVLWIAASWPIGLALDPARLQRPGESAYLIADLVILLPLALAAAAALRRRSASARGLLVATLGALAYDATHFAVHTAQEMTTAGGRFAVGAALALLLAGIAAGLRLALRETSLPTRA